MSQWIALLVGLGCLLMGVKFGGGEVISFIDIPSLLIVFITGVCFASSAHGFLRVLSALVAGFSPTHVTDEDSLRDAMVLQSLRNTICATAVVGYLIGVIRMLTSLDDPSSIGPAMAVALLTSLYAVVFGELILGMMVNKLHVRAGESAWSAPSNGLRGGLVAFALVVGHLSVFWLMMHSMQQGQVWHQCEELIALGSSDRTIKEGCVHHLCTDWHHDDVRQNASYSTRAYCHTELCDERLVKEAGTKRKELCARSKAELQTQPSSSPQVVAPRPGDGRVPAGDSVNFDAGPTETQPTGEHK